MIVEIMLLMLMLIMAMVTKMMCLTHSLYIAESPRDASCLSVASIVQYTSSASSASGLPLGTNKFCYLLCVVVVHAAGCDEYSFTDASPSVR